MDKGLAYHCYCSREELDAMREEAMAKKEKPRYDGRCRVRKEQPDGVEPVIRFKNPTEGAVVIEDLIKGKVVIQNSELDDLIIARSDGTPTYNLTVVVDDWDMGVTHVIRGDDHLNNTPRQINLLRALGAEPPIYAHAPMILGDDGKRMSKRHGATSVMEYRDKGFLPEALLNYLVRLGWSHGDQEVFSMEEMIELFDITEVNAAASQFNHDKLLWLNQQYIINSKPEHIAHHLSIHLGNLGIDPAEGPDILEVVAAQQERAQTLVEMAEISRFIYQDFDEYDATAAKKHLRPVAKEPLEKMREALSALEEWTTEALHDCVKTVSENLELNMGKVAQPLRVAVVGRAASPGIDVTLKLIGKEACLRRIDKALALIAERAANAG